MGYAVYLAAKQFALIPGVFLVIALLAYILLMRYPRWRGSVLLGLAVSVYMLSTPFVGTRLAASLQTYAPLPPPLTETRCGSVVVLTAGVHATVPGYVGPQPSSTSLERLRYGILLSRATKKDLVLIGGGPFGIAEANILADVATSEYHIIPSFVETRSRNTLEGAIELAKRFASLRGKKLCLVTSSSHMQRAVVAFKAAGFDVIPAPTGFVSLSPVDMAAFLPYNWALSYSNQWWSEVLGRFVYRIRLRLAF